MKVWNIYLSIGGVDYYYHVASERQEEAQHLALAAALQELDYHISSEEASGLEQEDYDNALNNSGKAINVT